MSVVPMIARLGVEIRNPGRSDPARVAKQFCLLLWAELTCSLQAVEVISDLGN